MDSVLDLSFFLRLLILLLVLGVLAGIDYLWHKERATRWREYLFLLACATLGGVFGASFGQLSVTLSPEYFEIVKGIGRDDVFRANVTILGLHAGFFMGAITACALMVCCRSVRLRRMARAVPWVLCLAVLAAPVGMFIVLGLDPDVQGITEEARGGFLRVTGLHYGLYAGAIAGIVVAVLRVRRSKSDETRREPVH